MRTENLSAAREYEQQPMTMSNAINDFVELQKGDVTFDDIPNGKILVLVEIYGFTWEHCLSLRTRA